MGLLRGFIEGTKTAVTKNMTVCQEKTEQKWDVGFERLVNKTVEGKLFDAGFALLDMIYNTHNITVACYTGMNEMSLGLAGYTSELYPSVVMDNVVFNFGNIFDAFRDVILFLTSSPRGELDLPYEAGYALGAAVYEIMKPSSTSKGGFPF